MRIIQLQPFLLAIAIAGCAQSMKDCEDCELMLEGMPTSLSWNTRISSSADAGEPLVVSGIVYQTDGKTPAPGVILYVYHTNQKGKYAPSSGQVNGRRHGHLRGWMKTDERGRYEFQTIRPGSYPNSDNPQHIHPIIKEASRIYWIDEYLFDDDPLLTKSAREHQQKRGGSGILKAQKDSQGVWRATRDITLGLNVTGYNK
ncbi:MAG: intradiol ring-cleavage dioxygenase [Cyclobacteriaceae bacterium]|nr:intradiol ring-cleavage dioxygenase [Cyclobacteriaceae bacterium]